eukprot:m51a1_g4140 putative ankyrin repeat-containing protein (800) ;mRNA; f:215536-218378
MASIAAEDLEEEMAQLCALPDGQLLAAENLFNRSDIDKSRLGEYLGKNKPTNKRVLEAFCSLFDFSQLELDAALRVFLRKFRLPGEAQIIDRFMSAFAQAYHSGGGGRGTLATADTAYVLAFSVIMLNTDLHNPRVKNKMSKAQFVKNNRGINEGADLPQEFLEAIYDRIEAEEITMDVDTGEKNGWLTKQGGRIKTWRRRWFVLKGNSLSYFRTPQDHEPLGVIILRNLSVGRCAQPRTLVLRQLPCLKGASAETPRSPTSRGKLIESKKKAGQAHHKMYLLMADTQDEMLSWCSAIGDALQPSLALLMTLQSAAVAEQQQQAAHCGSPQHLQSISRSASLPAMQPAAVVLGGAPAQVSGPQSLNRRESLNQFGSVRVVDAAKRRRMRVLMGVLQDTFHPPEGATTVVPIEPDVVLTGGAWATPTGSPAPAIEVEDDGEGDETPLPSDFEPSSAADSEYESAEGCESPNAKQEKLSAPSEPVPPVAASAERPSEPRPLPPSAAALALALSQGPPEDLSAKAAAPAAAPAEPPPPPPEPQEKPPAAAPAASPVSAAAVEDGITQEGKAAAAAAEAEAAAAMMREAAGEGSDEESASEEEEEPEIMACCPPGEMSPPSQSPTAESAPGEQGNQSSMSSPPPPSRPPPAVPQRAKRRSLSATSASSLASSLGSSPGSKEPDGVTPLHAPGILTMGPRSAVVMGQRMSALAGMQRTLLPSRSASVTHRPPPAVPSSVGRPRLPGQSPGSSPLATPSQPSPLSGKLKTPPQNAQAALQQQLLARVSERGSRSNSAGTAELETP